MSLVINICDQVVEDSSEIASARVSASHRKSMRRPIFKNKQQTGSIRNLSLSNISEENIDDNSNSEELRLKNKVNCCHVTFVCDDEKVTSDTSDNLNNYESDKDKVRSNEENEKEKIIGNKSDKEDKEDRDNCQVSDKKKRVNNNTAENMSKRCLVSRFVPEFIDNNKITIV